MRSIPSNRYAARIGIAMLTLLLSVPRVSGQAPDGLFHACYVPATGTVYRIRDANTPTACRPGQVEFSWLPSSAQVTSPGPALSLGNSGTGVAVSGHGTANNGVVGSTDASNGFAGVAGFGVQNGVVGFASAPDVGWGVKGTGSGTGVGVEGISPRGAGIRGQALLCDNSGCTATTGDAAQFVAGSGGILVHGFLSRFNGPGGWDEKFKVGADGSGLFAGDLSVQGNAFKPGGGSWSVLSDRRAKSGIEPIPNALEQLLRLHGVTFEYVDPSAFHEAPGRHIGMVAQEVEAVFPSWVDTGPDGYKRVTFRGFEAVTVEAMRDLEARIQQLERQNAELRRSMQELAAAFKALQQK